MSTPARRHLPILASKPEYDGLRRPRTEDQFEFNKELLKVSLPLAIPPLNCRRQPTCKSARIITDGHTEKVTARLVVFLPRQAGLDHPRDAIAFTRIVFIENTVRRQRFQSSLFRLTSGFSRASMWIHNRDARQHALRRNGLLCGTVFLPGLYGDSAKGCQFIVRQRQALIFSFFLIDTAENPLASKSRLFQYASHNGKSDLRNEPLRL